MKRDLNTPADYIYALRDFTQHLVSTAKTIKAQDTGSSSLKDLLKLTFEVSFETFGLEWGTDDERIYGLIFEYNQDILVDILA
jgi:hypothetical protein